ALCFLFGIFLRRPPLSLLSRFVIPVTIFGGTFPLAIPVGFIAGPVPTFVPIALSGKMPAFIAVMLPVPTFVPIALSGKMPAFIAVTLPVPTFVPIALSGKMPAFIAVTLPVPTFVPIALSGKMPAFIAVGFQFRFGIGLKWSFSELLGWAMRRGLVQSWCEDRQRFVIAVRPPP